MKKFMVHILLQDLDNDTRMRLLPAEQAMVKTWEENGTLLALHIKLDASGIYLVLLAQDAQDVDAKLSALPYYPYMKIEITPLRMA